MVIILIYYILWRVETPRKVDQMTYDIEKFLDVIFFLNTPMHEIGHIIFGWLSLNPTFPGGWDYVYSMRDGLIGTLGGSWGEYLTYLVLVETVGRRWTWTNMYWAAGIIYTLFTAMFYVGVDFASHEELKRTILTISGILALAVVLYRATKGYQYCFMRRVERAIMRKIKGEPHVRHS